MDKVVSFLEKVWRRLVEMGRNVQRDVERKTDELRDCAEPGSSNVETLLPRRLRSQVTRGTAEKVKEPMLREIIRRLARRYGREVQQEHEIPAMRNLLSYAFRSTRR